MSATKATSSRNPAKSGFSVVDSYSTTLLINSSMFSILALLSSVFSKTSSVTYPVSSIILSTNSFIECSWLYSLNSSIKSVNFLIFAEALLSSGFKYASSNALYKLMSCSTAYACAFPIEVAPIPLFGTLIILATAISSVELFTVFK